MDKIEDMYALSPMQEGMLFHSLFAPESNIYFRQLSCTIEGPLNVAAFEQAWQCLIDRHLILRSSFFWEELEKPLQIAHREMKVPLEVHDCRGLTSTEQEKRLETFRQAQQQRGFDLSTPPLMSLALFQIAENVYQFVWSYHHLLMDGWSRSLLFEEVMALYEAFRRGHAVNLKSPRPFSHYIAWLQDQDLEKAEGFWRETLKGFTSPTTFAPGRVADEVVPEREAYEEQRVRLSEATITEIQGLARRHRLTLNTIVQGAWALLLSRYCGTDDVVFGTSVAGRPTELEGVEAMVGVFINTLPVRVQLPAGEMLSSWLQRLQAQQVETRQYEYSPLVQVQGWSEVPRGQALFESLLVVENYPTVNSSREGDVELQIKNIRFLEKNNYPLTLIAELSQGMSLAISYDKRRFDKATIDRMLGHVQTLLESMVANPQERLSSIPILTREEREQLLLERSQPRVVSAPVGLSAGTCLADLFETQVERSPEAPAVMFEDQQISYGELNRRANQLAHHLQSRGAGPETIVGVFCDRSLETTIALLGILKAGAAYLPLDPEHPQGRLSFMLKDARVKMILTQEHVVGSLPPSAAAAEVVLLDSEWETTIARQSDENPRRAVPAKSLAYVIYTSGSTGNPKAVGVSHDAAVGHFTAMQKAFDLTASDRVLQFASLSFDVSLEQIIPTLLCGATLVLRGAEGWSMSELAGKIRDYKLTVVNLPTSYWHQLAQETEVLAQLRANETLRLVIAGGEAMLGERAQQWQSAGLKSVRLLNAYGPTEATITTSVYEVPRNAGEETFAPRVPIGRAVGQRRTYILDRYGEVAPVGVPGELHIGGPLLARGYLMRAKQTADRFIPDAYSGIAGARLYKTGDIARYLPEGEIEFVGRVDEQVKLRGYRIEPGEIEAVLAAHAEVRECAVIVREDVPGDRRLVAYVVSDSQSRATAGDVRNVLAKKLPEYMIPSAFVLMEKLPLTPNGKVDRNALPAPEHIESDVEKTFVKPQTPLEEQLAHIWSEILGVEQVGIYDNFFALGGHSLNLTQLASRIRETFKVEIPLQTLFELPTISEMTTAITAEQFRQETPEDITRMLEEMQQLSEDEIQILLEAERQFSA